MHTIPERILSGEFATASTKPSVVKAKVHAFRVACIMERGVQDNLASSKVFEIVWKHVSDGGLLAVWDAFNELSELLE